MKVKTTYLLPISQKGQVTIPVEVRKLLDVENQGKVSLTVLNSKQAVLKPPTSTLEQVFASVKPIKKNFLEIRKIARQDRVKNNL